jgi:hypothetical protein
MAPGGKRKARGGGGGPSPSAPPPARGVEEMGGNELLVALLGWNALPTGRGGRKGEQKCEAGGVVDLSAGDKKLTRDWALLSKADKAEALDVQPEDVVRSVELAARYAQLCGLRGWNAQGQASVANAAGAALQRTSASVLMVLEESAAQLRSAAARNSNAAEKDEAEPEMPDGSQALFFLATPELPELIALHAVRRRLARGVELQRALEAVLTVPAFVLLRLTAAALGGVAPQESGALAAAAAGEIGDAEEADRGWWRWGRGALAAALGLVAAALFWEWASGALLDDRVSLAARGVAKRRLLPLLAGTQAEQDEGREVSHWKACVLRTGVLLLVLGAHGRYLGFALALAAGPLGLDLLAEWAPGGRDSDGLRTTRHLLARLAELALFMLALADSWAALLFCAYFVAPRLASLLLQLAASLAVAAYQLGFALVALGRRAAGKA